MSKLCNVNFRVLQRSSISRARRGMVETENGVIETPAFVPVGTNASVRSLDADAALQRVYEPLGASHLPLTFVNTFHMMVSPGTDVVKQHGGLHQFMHHRGPLITDSGGFQLFSMASRTPSRSVGNDTDHGKELKGGGGSSKRNEACVVRISEQGAVMRAYTDGRRIELTPESSALAQVALGADIVVPLDHLLPLTVSQNEERDAFDRTHRWQQRSIETYREARTAQAVYGIVHGGVRESWRLESFDRLLEFGCDGYAIGGSLGANHSEMRRVLAFSANDAVSRVLDSKHVHLLGIGDSKGIKIGVRSGCDTFDSCYPTRVARHGTVLSLSQPNESGASLQVIRTSIRGAATLRLSPRERLGDQCECATCQLYSRSYVAHLLRAEPPVAWTLITIHNLHTMFLFMKIVRDEIKADRL